MDGYSTGMMGGNKKIADISQGLGVFQQAIDIYRQVRKRRPYSSFQQSYDNHDYNLEPQYYNGYQNKSPYGFNQKLRKTRNRLFKVPSFMRRSKNKRRY